MNDEKKRTMQLGAISEILSDSGFRFADFTPKEQKCISNRIPKLLDKGHSQDEAVAVSISICAPKKANKKSSRAAKFDETGQLPGGNYHVTENSDGTFTIFNVPIFAEHTIPGTEEKIGREWMQRALDRAAQRLENDAYLPPLHVRHHGMGQETQSAGKFRLTKLKKAVYDGDAVWVLFADLVNIPAEIFQKIKGGDLSYRSVEIHDLEKPEIDSLALLDDEVPFFRFPLLTVDVSEIETAQRMNDCDIPMLAYRALGHGSSTLFSFEGLKMIRYGERLGRHIRKILDEKEMTVEDLVKKINKIKGPNTAVSTLQEIISGEIETPSDPMLSNIAKALNVTKKSLEDLVSGDPGPAKFQGDNMQEEKKKEEKMMEGPDEETDVSLNDIMDMLKELMSMIMAEEKPEEDQADKGETMDTKPVDLADLAAGSGTPALLASLDATTSRIEKLEREREIEKAIATAKQDLAVYGLDPKTLDNRLHAVAGDYGVKGITLYVSSVKENVTPDPSPDWNGEIVDENMPECVTEFTKYGQAALEKALKYSREYDSFNGRLSQDRKTFITDSLTADGLIR